MNPELVLVVDDEANIRKILEAILASAGYRVLCASNLAEAKAFIAQEDIAVILSDLRLKTEDGLSLLKWLRDEGVVAPCIILTAHGTVDSAVDAMKQGAFDYISKPFEREELLALLHKAVLQSRYLRHHALSFQNKDREELPIIGEHPKMQEIFELIDRVSATSSTVLIGGESGTGKELVAQAIHDLSDRKRQPFIKINCAAIPATLMESELFGYERGAFTGAVNSKPGRFELADGGTLFLDEIGEMSTEMQVKLLRVLQEQKFERVGGIRTLEVNVRLIAATNKDLEAEVKAGRFREDLYYRLNVVPVRMPALRERTSDIPILIARFLEKFSKRLKRPTPTIEPECLGLMSSYAWPGNIRQLENVIERFIVMNSQKTIGVEDLPQEIRENIKSVEDLSKTSLKQKVKSVTRIVERETIESALEDNGRNVTQTARALNISRKGLQLKMKELGLRQ